MTPTPPAGMPRHAGPRGNGEAFAATIAPTPANLELFQQARATPSAPAQVAPAPRLTPPATERDLAPVAAAVPKAVVHGLLVTVNRDGSDGSTVEIASETFDIGRSEGSLNFGEDLYLAARHARLTARNGKVVLLGLDKVNGVFIKVQGACDLAAGDSFLVGKELLRFEPVTAEEREPTTLMEHGVRVFGTVPREAWGRLRQLTVAATTRDVWHLTRPELVLGREEGDVTFPDDEFMSRRHATVKRVGQKTRLEDLNSSNGTFVRVRGERELKSGDLLRVGDQLLRFEVA
jgi:pSer/pThr/pTyr-binding forkhead associated (FHA) protein